MVISHERALFGYKDPIAVRYVPGLLAKVQELPTKRQMWMALSVISGFFLIIIFKQYAIIPALMSAFAK